MISLRMCGGSRKGEGKEVLALWPYGSWAGDASMRRGEGAYDVTPGESRFVMRAVIQMNYFRGAVGGG